MQRIPTCVAVVVALLLLAMPISVAAITVDVSNTFSGATTEGWGAGIMGFQPIVVPNGGPGGAGDGFLQVTSFGGFGANSRMVFFNETADWTGNYTGAGVEQIVADMRNPGGSSLNMHVLLMGAGGGFVTTNPAVLSNDGTWHLDVTFGVQAADLSPITFSSGLSVSPGTDVNATLATVTRASFFHTTTPQFWPGDVIAATVDIDNIRAPEPSTLVMLATGGLGIFGYTWRRKRKRA